MVVPSARAVNKREGHKREARGRRLRAEAARRGPPARSSLPAAPPAACEQPESRTKDAGTRRQDRCRVISKTTGFAASGQAWVFVSGSFSHGNFDSNIMANTAGSIE